MVHAPLNFNASRVLRDISGKECSVLCLLENTHVPYSKISFSGPSQPMQKWMWFGLPSLSSLHSLRLWFRVFFLYSRGDWGTACKALEAEMVTLVSFYNIWALIGCWPRCWQQPHLNLLIGIEVRVLVLWNTFAPALCVCVVCVVCVRSLYLGTSGFCLLWLKLRDLC